MEIIAETMGSNAYGFQEIHIYEFNIDGEGSALISHDDQQALEYCHKNDLLLILCGDPEQGTRWYQPKGKIGH